MCAGFRDLQRSGWEAIVLTGHIKRYTIHPEGDSKIPAFLKTIFELFPLVPLC